MTILALSIVPVSPAGVDISTAALISLGANTGVSFKNDGQCGLIVNNASGSSINVTEVIGRQVEGIAPTGPPRAVPAGKTYIFGSLSVLDFLSTDGTGMTYVNVSLPTSVSVGLIEIPKTA